ncbi:spore maturation protein [Caldibacillus sp. 210928-DFI.2.22]|uniref:nucleoside recognition domain-containing protein n=1 Tax=Bacillaceae TaxID=186817 RepID=UPI001D071523|nr:MULTISPECIES: nucleoside recognition domain-containing protein [unclassified Caldibacillus]MCB7069157.1 spore maturation protein [Caldibacillus sp. 210928-DFI.2.22]MCB7072480.1 spore maturation protein [Caldibacillus sp. 210928-DFI.2.18]
MINLIWVLMIVIGIVFAMFNGTMDEVNKAIFQGAGEAVTLCIGFISILVFWLGLMRIAQASGLLDKLANVFRPIIKKIFPDIPDDHPVMGYILSNMIANMFGLGNAATPLGIKAMEELKELNGGKSEASRSMITFLVINTASITIIPTTVLSIRMNYDSTSPAEIVLPTIIASVFATVCAIFIDRFMYNRKKRNRVK